MRERAGAEMIAAELPAWLSPEAWAAFKKMRAKKGSRAPFTKEAEARILSKLDTLRLLGNDPAEVLWQSVESGWSGVFPLKTRPMTTPALNQTVETEDLKRTRQWMEDQERNNQSCIRGDEVKARIAAIKQKLRTA